MSFQFPSEQTCPRCSGKFESAERKTEYDPVVVVACPHCAELLWRPGLDDASPLYPFDPDADAGGI